jgi:hypothetical protein
VLVRDRAGEHQGALRLGIHPGRQYHCSDQKKKEEGSTHVRCELDASAGRVETAAVSADERGVLNAVSGSAAKRRTTRGIHPHGPLRQTSNGAGHQALTCGPRALHRLVVSAHKGWHQHITKRTFRITVHRRHAGVVVVITGRCMGMVTGMQVLSRQCHCKQEKGQPDPDDRAKKSALHERKQR